MVPLTYVIPFTISLSVHFYRAAKTYASRFTLVIYKTIWECIYANNFTRNHFTSDVIQLLSILVSVTSLAWAMVSYTKARTQYKHRLQQTSRPTKCGKVILFIRDTLCLFLWRFCTIGSRVIVFALPFVVRNWSSHNGFVPYYVLICLLSIWVGPQFLEACLPYGNTCREMCTDTFVIVNFMDFHDDCSGPSRMRATIYYCVLFILTSVLMIMWQVLVPLNGDLKTTVTVLSIIASVLFLIGMVFMTLHYSCCHENRENIRKWVPYNKKHLWGLKGHPIIIVFSVMLFCVLIEVGVIVYERLAN